MSNSLVKFLPILIGTLWVAFIASFRATSGLELDDDGSILVLAWRVINGDLPYRDFLYARGIFTVYFHTIWLILPDTWQWVAYRLFFYFQLAGPVLLILFLLIRNSAVHFRFYHYPFLLVPLTLAFYRMSPFPYQTTDAVMLIGFGIASLLGFLYSKNSRERIILVFTAGFLFALSGFCRQNFFGLPVLLLVFCLLAQISVLNQNSRFQIRPRETVFATLGIALPFFIHFVILKWTDSWTDYVFQIQAASETKRLQFLALDTYLKEKEFWIGVCIGAFLVLARGLIFPRFFYALLGISGLLFVYFQIYPSINQVEVHRLLFGVSLAIGATELLRSFLSRQIVSPESLILIGSLATMWSVAISPGNPSGLYGLPLIAGYLLLRFKDDKPGFGTSLIPSVATIAILITVIDVSLRANDVQLADEKRTYAMGELFPKFGPIRSHRTVYERFKDLKLVLEKSPAKDEPFCMLPDLPSANYLSNRRSICPIDWSISNEIFRQWDWVKEQYLLRQPLIISHKRLGWRYLTPKIEGCIRKERVGPLDHWLYFESNAKVIFESEHLCVWRLPS